MSGGKGELIWCICLVCRFVQFADPSISQYREFMTRANLEFAEK